MSSDYLSAARLRYRDAFRSHHGDAFQHWFESLAHTIHGDDCFVPIRVTHGDGGLDGLVLREGRVYQLFAPSTPPTDARLAAKIRADFSKAKETLTGDLKAWSFVHTAADGKIGHRAAAEANRLRFENPDIDIQIVGIDALWEQIAKLPAPKVAALFGVPLSGDGPELQARALLTRARELDLHEKRREAFDATEKAFAIAETAGLVDLHVEALVSLALMSSDRHGFGDRPYYLRQAKDLVTRATDPVIQVMFERAQAAALKEQGDLSGSEAAYLRAIATAEAPPNRDVCEGQLCVARAEYVHLLLRMHRRDQAEAHLHKAEEYARAHPDQHDGQTFQVALESGLHWAVTGQDEDAAVLRIGELETAAGTGHRAVRFAGGLVNAANQLAHHKCNRAAVAAAEAAARLADKMPKEIQERFLPGALYTLAMVHFTADRLEEALERARSLLRMPITEHTAQMRFAAAQLAAVISRRSGDPVAAVATGEIALGLAPDIDSVFMAKMSLSESLADHGDPARSLELAREAYQLVENRASVPKAARLETMGHIAALAAQLGQDEAAQRAMTTLEELADDDPQLGKRRDGYAKLTEANTEIRKRLFEISLVGQDEKVLRGAVERVRDFERFLERGDSAPRRARTWPETLHEANALTVAPLIEWWLDTSEDHEAAALDYDYWGRGSFAQILRNLQAFPQSLNVTLEVRTVEDIRNAVRLWGLYADFILLVWKGRTRSGSFTHFVDGEWFGPWGAGYLLAMGDQVVTARGRHRYPALGWGSWLPPDVTRLLLTEAQPFIGAGRLLIVPASGVGCVSPGHGAMEQLLAEVANSIPAVQSNGALDGAALPYARGIPLNVLFDFVNEAEDDLRSMRNLLLTKAAHVRRNGLQASPRDLELDIRDALRRLRQRGNMLAHRRGLNMGEQPTRWDTAPLNLSGYGLAQSDAMGFVPLLRLDSMGYGWKVGTFSSARPPYRFAPSEDEAIGTWLAPPEPGPRFIAVKRLEEPS